MHGHLNFQLFTYFNIVTLMLVTRDKNWEVYKQITEILTWEFSLKSIRTFPIRAGSASTHKKEKR